MELVLEEKWKKLENERAWNDLISIIMSSTPGPAVLGNYLIEPCSCGICKNEYDSDDSVEDGFIHLEPSVRFHSRFIDYDLFEKDDSGMRHAFRAVSSAALARPSCLLGSVGLR